MLLFYDNSFKLSSKANNGTSKFTSTPVKSTIAISYKKENIASPISIKPVNGTSKFTTPLVKPTTTTSFKRDNIASPMSNDLPSSPLHLLTSLLLFLSEGIILLHQCVRR